MIGWQASKWRRVSGRKCEKMPFQLGIKTSISECCTHDKWCVCVWRKENSSRNMRRKSDFRFFFGRFLKRCQECLLIWVASSNMAHRHTHTFVCIYTRNIWVGFQCIRFSHLLCRRCLTAHRIMCVWACFFISRSLPLQFVVKPPEYC